MKRLIVLGATGSIGSSTLDVVRSYRDRFDIVGLSAHTREERLGAIAREFPGASTVLSGTEGGERLVGMIRETEAELVVNAITGADGLASSIAALESGKDLALANKETIVMAGDLVRELADRAERTIIPIDSEHSALFFLLERIGRERVTSLILTASGGAFRDTPVEELANVSVADALAHPTWDMGPKITIDSATMANKGLEIIEAVRLFGYAEHDVEVYIHRQSKVHGMARSIDGSVYTQASDPDMRVPIQHALSYPDELPCAFGSLDFDGLELTFETPDPEKYPAIELARAAARNGGEYPAVYNAANEVAVDAFVHGEISFPQIPRVIECCLAATWEKLLPSFQQVFDADRRARETARACISRYTNTV